MTTIVCLDMCLSGQKGSIASYLIPHRDGAVLVDCGPGSTQENLTSALAVHGLTPKNITHVLLTHIHLDHAGAAGWLARQGAQVYVHPLGAPHLLNPEKLIASARRIYGDRMDELWGEFLPVPAANLTEVKDGAQIECGDVHFTALYTPGHAEHHVAYFLEDICFSGDVGGVRYPGPFYVSLPFVPPETHLGKWRDSLERIRATNCKRIALTHFGIYEDAILHLAMARQTLDDVEHWLERVMPTNPDVEALGEHYLQWLHERGKNLGLAEEILRHYDSGNAIQTSASALFRYWHKVRMVS